MIAEEGIASSYSEMDIPDYSGCSLDSSPHPSRINPDSDMSITRPKIPIKNYEDYMRDLGKMDKPDHQCFIYCLLMGIPAVLALTGSIFAIFDDGVSTGHTVFRVFILVVASVYALLLVSGLIYLFVIYKDPRPDVHPLVDTSLITVVSQKPTGLPAGQLESHASQ